MTGNEAKALPVSYFLLADPAGLFLCDDTLHLLVINALLLNLKIRHHCTSNSSEIGNRKTPQCVQF